MAKRYNEMTEAEFVEACFDAPIHIPGCVQKQEDLLVALWEHYQDDEREFNAWNVEDEWFTVFWDDFLRDNYYLQEAFANCLEYTDLKTPIIEHFEYVMDSVYGASAWQWLSSGILLINRARVDEVLSEYEKDYRPVIGITAVSKRYNKNNERN